MLRFILFNCIYLITANSPLPGASSPHTTTGYFLPPVFTLTLVLKYSELSIGQYKFCRVVKHKSDTDDNVSLLVVLNSW
jgi:hypothetical protein